MIKEIMKNASLAVVWSLAIIIVGNLIVSYAHFISDLISPLSPRWKISITLFHILVIVIPIGMFANKGDER